jgi:outer membrane protein assembly factor BamB
VYVPLADGRVVALALATGDPIWERKLGGSAADVLALEDRLFVGSKDNFFYCLDSAKGKVKWRWRTGGDIAGAAVVDESRVYFLSLDNVLRALQRGNGVLQWQRPLPTRPSWAPLLMGDVLLVAGVSPDLRGYGTKDGQPVGDLAAGAELLAPPHYVAAGPGTDTTPMLVILSSDGQGARLAALKGKAPDK